MYLTIIMYQVKSSWYRGSRPDVFCKKAILKRFAGFIGKHLLRSLLLINLQAIASRPATLLKRLRHRCSPIEFAKFLRTDFLRNIYEACF